MRLLQEESELEEIVRLVGQDSLSAIDRLKLEAARSVREDFLHQNSFDEIDTYTSLQKQQRMLSLMMQFFYEGQRALERNASFRDLVNVPARDGVSRLKFVPEAEVMERADRLTRELTEQIEAAIPQGVM